MQMLVHIALPCMYQILILFILTVLGLNKFLKKLKYLLDIETNISRIQSSNSIICGYFCNGFIDFMLAGKIWFY